MILAVEAVISAATRSLETQSAATAARAELIGGGFFTSVVADLFDDPNQNALNLVIGTAAGALLVGMAAPEVTAILAAVGMSEGAALVATAVFEAFAS